MSSSVRVRTAAELARTRGLSREERDAILGLVARSAARFDVVDDSAVLRAMGGRDFEWPEFDHWQALFASRGRFPLLWTGLESAPYAEAPVPVRESYRRRKLALLVDWLRALATTRVEIRAALVRYTTRGLIAEVVCQSRDAACPACGPLHREIVHGTAADLPPFHPGCRCLVLAAPESHRAERRN
jgi:hypothetical protein